MKAEEGVLKFAHVEQGLRLPVDRLHVLQDQKVAARERFEPTKKHYTA